MSALGRSIRINQESNWDSPYLPQNELRPYVPHPYVPPPRKAGVERIGAKGGRMSGMGAWITAQQATPSAANHHQPGRLMRGGQQRAWGPSADRLTTLEGFGNLAALGSEDESMGTDEEAEAAAEKDTDWVGLVKGLATALSPVAKEAVKGAFAQSKLNQGWTGDMISRYLGMGETRAAGVNAGTASMPTAGWIGIGVAVVAVLGMMFFMVSRRR